ncbi:MAG: ribosome maturation factor RimM [Beijerinckiaceae bacterium]
MAKLESDLVLVGTFGAPHGVRGEIRIRSHTEEPLTLAGFGELTDASGKRKFRIISARAAQKNMLVARIEGISDRSGAETLTNLDLYVPRAQLPEPEEEEFYHADLIGLKAFLTDGTYYGRVTTVENFGAGDILEIERENGVIEPLSFTKITCPEVNLDTKRIVVVPPAEVETSGDSEP